MSHAGTREDLLRARLVAGGVRDGQWEGSVRGGTAVAPAGMRMMVERADAAVVRTIIEALEAPAADAEAMIGIAGRTGVPLIAGWDLSGAEAVAKVYVNASDAAESVRREIAGQLGWEGIERLGAPPHVLGVNSTKNRVERKAYVQGAETEPPGDHAPSRWLWERAREGGLLGGTVTSFDVGRGGAVPRAFFVALRGDADRLLAALPGWDEAAVDRALPFARGQCRSIGVDLRTHAGATWTAYFKPAELGVPVWSIEPAVRYRSGELRVAVYVAPADFAGRAYARTRRHAISFRGEIPLELFDPLSRWVIAALERGGEDALRSPPAPWVMEP